VVSNIEAAMCLGEPLFAVPPLYQQLKIAALRRIAVLGLGLVLVYPSTFIQRDMCYNTSPSKSSVNAF
jgi:hypothetical protein